MEKPQRKDYLFVGYLINPSKDLVTASECKFEDLDVNAILSILKRNKVPLVSFDKEQREAYPEFFKAHQFEAQHETEHALFTNLRNEWAKVREEFLKTGIESMLIKSVGSFPYKSSNLDVLIKQSKREQAESLLKGMGYIQLHNVEEPYKTLFRKFAGRKSTSVIHLHNKVAWINPFHDEELLWAHYRNSSRDDLVDIPSPEDSILILTAHWFYEDKEIKLSDIMKISACLKEDDLDWDYMTAVAEKMGWLNGLYFGLLVQSYVEKGLYGESLIQNNQLKKMKAALPRWMCVYLNKKVFPREISLPFRLPKIFGKFLHFIKTIKDKTTTPSKKLLEMYIVVRASLFVTLFYKWKVNIRYQPPMLISISGVDGSGKSTYAENLYETLNFCELKTRFVWSRVGSSGFLKPFSRMAKIFHSLKRGKPISKHSENFEESEARRKDLFGKSPVFRILGLFTLLLEMLGQYSFKVALPLFFKKVVICDRYIYDTLVDITTRYGVNLNSREGKLFARILTVLTPKPDIAYLLLISPEDACSRKEVNAKESHLIKDQIGLYQDIASMFSLRQINANNNTCITTINDKMINEILASYYNKWPESKYHIVF